MKTHYQTLGVDPQAPAEVIEVAWKTLMRLYHPDNGSRKDARKCAEVNAAHDILKDPAKRKAYDVQLKAHKVEQQRARQAQTVQPENPEAAYPEAYPGLTDLAHELGKTIVDRALAGMDPTLRSIFEQTLKGRQ